MIEEECFMTGPSLKQLHAHHAIHAGALAGGAIAKTEELKQFMREENVDKINMAVSELLDYWESRIISHADAEEEENGFYQEIIELKPLLKEEIVALKRDHNLLRTIAEQIKTQMEEEGFSIEILEKFQALIIVNEIHSHDEEQILLANE